MMKKFWLDEGGALLSMEAVLLATILVIGVIVGLSAVQDAVVSELADVAQAIGNVNQSYSTNGFTGHNASTAGASFADAVDTCDDDSGNAQNSKCVAVAAAAAETSN